jgi:hypothetical protein
MVFCLAADMGSEVFGVAHKFFDRCRRVWCVRHLHSVCAMMTSVSDDTTGRFLNESRHVSVWIAVTAETAYQFISDQGNLPLWVAGLDLSAVTVEFSPTNAFGVLDHVVRLPGGEEFYNPMRVLPADDGQERCEVVFSVRRRPGMSDDDLDADAAAVEVDLRTLRGLLQA